MKYDGHTLAARNTFLIAPDGTIRKIYTQVNPATHSQEVLADLNNVKEETQHD